MNKRNHVAHATSTICLGALSIKKFLSHYWQQRPLLVRQAFARGSGFAPLSNAEILQLARYDEAESRLISQRKNTWTLEHGPFTAARLAQIRKLQRASKATSLPDDNWTILIQDTQHFSHEAHRLLSQFAFLPYARIDDLMVSYAVKGGGVGPHIDSYDVFLLQGSGKRRWKISTHADQSLVEDAPLKILKRFKAEQEWVLEEGDMLYLPPGVAHHGTAETDDCVTWSIGFRAPSHQELLDAYLDQLRDTVEIAGRYSDPKRGLVEVPAYIDPSLRRKLAAGISSVLDSASTPQALGKFIGEYLTAAKSHVEFMPPTPHRSLSQFSRLAAKRGLGLDLRSRMLFDDAHTYLNGRTMSFDSTPTAHQHSQLKTLANSRCLNAPQLDPQIIRQLYPYWTSGELEILE